MPCRQRPLDPADVRLHSGGFQHLRSQAHRDTLRPPVAGQEPDILHEDRTGASPHLESPASQQTQLPHPVELGHYLRYVHTVRSLDVHHCDQPVRMRQQQIRYVPTDADSVVPAYLERLSGNPDHILGKIRQQDAGELQTALVGHQTIARHRVVPARVVPTPLVPAELPHRQPGRYLFTHQQIPRGLREDPVCLAVADLHSSGLSHWLSNRDVRHRHPRYT